MASLVPLPVPAGEGGEPALSCLQFEKILKEKRKKLSVNLFEKFRNKKCAILKINLGKCFGIVFRPKPLLRFRFQVWLFSIINFFNAIILEFFFILILASMVCQPSFSRQEAKRSACSSRFRNRSSSGHFSPPTLQIKKKVLPLQYFKIKNKNCC